MSEFRLETAERALAVTPSDTVAIALPNPAFLPRRLFVGGAGNVVAVMADGGVVTFTGVPAGSFLPIKVTRVNATGTTATNIVALW